MASDTDNDNEALFKHLTGFAYNPSHIFHKNTVNQNHPESENRIKLALSRIKESNALEYVADYTDPSLHEEQLNFSLTNYILEEIHDEGYMHTLKKLEKMSQTEIDDLCRKFDSIAMTPNSFKVAHEAAAYCVTLTEKVAKGELKNAFALVRPPGHHAHNDHPEGFCVLNNVAICAQLAIERKYATKVLIVDFDIHHGNGTQTFFYDDKRVTYLSIHRYESGHFWPHKRYSDYDCTGRGTGRGHNINIPINENGGTHHDYLFILFTIIIPFARELQPDMVFISAGFDACIGDPIGYMDVYPEIFPHFIYQLSPMCNGKIVAVLEGGYNHSAVAVCVDMCLRVMIGEKPPYFKYTKVPRASTVISCMNAIGALREDWPYVNSFYDLAPYCSIAHQSILPSFTVGPGMLASETGNINQNNLRNLINSHSLVKIQLPKTKLFNINIPFPMYNVKNIPVDPHANQYEDLFGIIDEFASVDYPFMSAVYAIRQPKLIANADGTVEPEPDDENWVPKRKNARTSETTVSFPEAGPSTSTPNSNGPQNALFQPKKCRNGTIIEEKENDPDPRKFDRLCDLMKGTLAHAMRKKNWRIMVVQWGFSFYCSTYTQRCRVLSVAVGDPQDGTSTFFPCDLVRSFNDDGLMGVIDRLIIPVGVDLQPHLCILCLNLNEVDGKYYGNTNVIRALIWHMQGIFNNRLLVIVDGQEKDPIGLYTADFLYGKECDIGAPPRPCIRKNDSAIRSVIECYLKNPCPTKDYLRTLIRRIN